MDTIAILLASLKEHHRIFVIKIIDHIIEEIIRGCEKNDFKEAQRRVAIMKFMGECYNYKVIHTETIFDLFYKLMNIDHYYHQEDEYMKALDSPADSFRIRLICTALDSLGRYF
jgi:regulator of nonsense transcripts 2